jgi:hypothetical protein
MIETYAFIGVFALQILAMSVLYPAWFIGYSRRQAASIPAERLASLYPDIDVTGARERFLRRYRALNTDIAVVGLLLLVWAFSYLQRPDSDIGPVEVGVGVYFLVQALLPLGLVVWRGVRFNRMRKGPLLEGKRKAVLQRRGLFDFVPPAVVYLAILGYILFVAFVISIRLQPHAGFSGLVDIGVITVNYAIQASVVYAVLYGKKSNPFETHTGRMRTIGLIVKSSVYSCIACVVFFSLNLTLGLFELHRWEPFALSTFFVVIALLSLMGLTASPRRTEADGLTPVQ